MTYCWIYVQRTLNAHDLDKLQKFLDIKCDHVPERGLNIFNKSALKHFNIENQTKAASLEI